MTLIGVYDFRDEIERRVYDSARNKLNYYAVLTKGGMATSLTIKSYTDISYTVLKRVEMYPNNSGKHNGLIRRYLYELTEEEYTIAMCRFF